MRLRPFFLALALLAAGGRASATHIVGGELNYECLGNQQYRITLTIFRDCFNGDPLAWFDNPASVGIFDLNNNLVSSVGQGGQILFELIGNDTLQPVLSNDCFVVPPNVCVHTTTYVDTVTLPPIPGGYQLAYQRCCRNGTILNIVSPLSTGATFYNYISETALQSCNSSAVFNDWPPIYICAGEPIHFDHSASDADGDSLVYELCTPLTGASTIDPQPQPPFAPPYTPVSFVNPPYSLGNLLGGEALSIDPQTGLLTGTPSTIGQFVVGICVREYRAGQLISTSRRDFQYNVGLCGQTTSAFFGPSVQCEGLEVFFDNQSIFANQFDWQVSTASGAPIFSSNSNDLLFSFPDTGQYSVQLVASADGFCRDTLVQAISLQAPSLVADFSYTLNTCSDTAFLQLSDLSSDALSSIVSWFWEIGDGQEAEVQNPTFAITQSWPELDIRLIVTAANGCEQVAATSLSVAVVDVNIPDAVAACDGEPLLLNPGGSPAYLYTWAPAEGLSNPNIASPIASPGSTTLYTVTVVVDAACTFVKSVLVNVPDAPISLSVPDSVSGCGPALSVTATSPEAVYFYWASDEDFAQILAEGSSPTQALSPPGGTAATVYVMAEDLYGCVARAELLLLPLGPRYSLQIPPPSCAGRPLDIVLRNDKPGDTLQIAWSPAGLIVGGNGADSISVLPQGEAELLLSLSNQYGCTVLDTIALSTLNTVPPLSIVALPDTVFAEGESVQLVATFDFGYSYAWSPAEGLSATDIFNPLATPAGETTYSVTITDADGCQNTASIRLLPRASICAEPHIFIPTAFSPNGDGENDQWQVLGEAVESLEAVVYNRWGQKVFEADSPTASWDGSFEGQALAPDVFGYHVRIGCPGGLLLERQGNLTLLR